MKDVLLAGTYEFGEGDTEASPARPGLRPGDPRLRLLPAQSYYRKPDGNRARRRLADHPGVVLHHSGGQPDILIDGYMDWVINNKSASTSRRNQSDYHANLHFNPQVRSYDLGKALGYEPKHLYVGLSTTTGPTSTV